MWRYRELMPLFAGETPVTLGEGFTPLVHAARLGARLGMERLFIKDESLNPTNSFKARGQSAAITRALGLGVDDRVGAVGRQRGQRDGGIRRARRARARRCSCRSDVKTPFARECVLYGAEVTLVDGLITDAARVAAERGGPLGWYDVSTLKEPYRIEGKKTMGYELAEQMDWRYPDWIIYPTGGGTGMVGMWKAFDEMEAIGWIAPQRRPRMVSVQAEGCAPIVAGVRPGHREGADVGERDDGGRRAARAAGDRRLPDPARRARERRNGPGGSRSGDGRRDDCDRLGRGRERRAGRRGRACRARTPARPGHRSSRDESVVLFNTGGALKYLDALPAR